MLVWICNREEVVVVGKDQVATDGDQGGPSSKLDQSLVGSNSEILADCGKRLGSLSCEHFCVPLDRKRAGDVFEAGQAEE
mmetsp:Transcript_705/g.2143  ORF Transcript_705/g.2143 Transcript_705/m.2143 type:complete len:80 (+) Transcript_705:723-962(+)